MAINDPINESWQGHDHGEVEAALKAVLTQLLNAVERIPQGGISIDALSDSLKALINNAVPNTRKVNNKALNSDITLGAADVGALPADTVIPEGVTVDSAMSSTSEHAVQNKVIKAYVDGLIQGLQNVLNTITQDGGTQGAIDTFNEVKAFLAGISSSDTLAAKLALLVPQSRTINSKPLTGNITIGINDIDGLAAAIANAGSGAVSVTSNQDGTFVIHVGETDYTINLNHTHEGMAKLVVDTAANLPDVEDMEEDTIYGEVEDGEISVLYVGGIPFYGGGGAVSGPALRRPAGGATIDMGQTTSGTVSKTINVKGKSLTQALTIELDGTGYTFGTTQPSGVTRDSSTQLTIPASSISAVNSLNGIDIVVVYTGNDTDENASGTLGITSGTPDNVSVEATLVANKTVYEDLAGVKFTGSQWLQTDYYPNPNTEFVMQLRFEENAISNTATGSEPILRAIADAGDAKFYFYTGASDSRFHIFCITDKDQNPIPVDVFLGVGNSNMFALRSTLSFVKGSPGTVTFNCGETYSKSLPSVALQSSVPMEICGRSSGQTMYNVYDLTIFELTITENGDAVRHWVPKTKNGVPGLYDTVNNTFISSETATELVAIPLTNNN